MKKDDLFYFEQAMIMAREAFKLGYSPVGAVLAADGEVISAQGSRRDIGNIYHAEWLTLYNWQKTQITPTKPITLYSTLEPCIMCLGMAAVLKVGHIKWLVDDIWGGTRLLNYNMPYVQKRFPTMDRVNLPDLHTEAQNMWDKYRNETK